MDFNHDTSTIDVSGVSGQTLTISGNGALQLPVGADANRGTASAGRFRWSTTNSKLEVAIDGTTWKQLQFYSAELDGVATLSTTGLVSRTGANTYTTRSIAVPAAGLTISNGDGVSGNPTLALANDLAALEALSGTAFVARTGTDTWATRTIGGTASNISVSGGDGTANVVINLIDAGSPISDQFVRITTDSKGRVTSSASVSSTNITTSLGYTPLNRAGDSLTAGDLTLFQDPTQPMHAATKQYVDQRAAGLDPKGSVRAHSGGVSFNIATPGTTSFGGVTLTSGDRVLLKDQSTGSQNGIYVFNGSSSAMTRATDADSNAKVTSGMYTFVEEGSGAGQGWILTTANPITLGTTSLTFAQFNGSSVYTAANGIALNGGTFETDSASLLRGLHTLASNGILVKTGSNTVANRSIAVPAAGLTISNANGVSGDPTLALANDLAAVEGLSGTGIAVRTGTDTWNVRTLQGTSNQITISNGSGTAADPSIGIASDAVLPGNIALTLPSGTNAQETGATNGMVRYNSDITAGGRNRQRFNGAWSNIGTGDGTVTSVGVTTSTDGLSVSGTVTTTGSHTINLSTELQNLKSGIATANGGSAWGILVLTASNTFTTRTVASGTGISITNPAGTAGNITISNTGVTSVSLSLPTQFNVTTSNVTTTGTLTAAWNTQTANTVLAGPTSGGATAPTFRALGYTDLPLKLFSENQSSPSANTTGGTNSVVIGNGGNARVTGQVAIASGQFSGAGDAQGSDYILRNTTTTNSATALFLDGSSARLVLPNNSAFYVTVMVVGRRTDVADGSCAHKHEFLVKRDATAATAAIVGNVSKTVVAETNTAWDSTVAADTTNGGFNITVTGENSKTIRWVARVISVEVVN